LREIEKFIIRQPPKGEKDDYDSENSWISDGLREIEKFIIRQPPKGEKDDYDSENSWISDGLPSSSRDGRRGRGENLCFRFGSTKYLEN